MLQSQLFFKTQKEFPKDEANPQIYWDFNRILSKA